MLLLLLLLPHPHFPNAALSQVLNVIFEATPMWCGAQFKRVVATVLVPAVSLGGIVIMRRRPSSK
jgi:hypothetical protein